jgi:hypothetical protein
MKIKKKKKDRGINKTEIIILLFGILFILLILYVNAADPVSPDSISVSKNETKGAASSQIVNISGGYIATLNLNATIQDSRWKAFVGNVSGSYTLDDSSGATIYDWTLSSITGRVYATRKTTSVTWGSIVCASVANLNAENTYLSHTSPDDNLNVTFNTTAGATHNPFYVGGVLIPADTCPTLNTYRNDNPQDSYFEEMALYDTSTLVYATIMEQDEVGYDGATYDFQMVEGFKLEIIILN